MHLHGGQLRQDLGHVLQGRPVELQVLAGTEVAVALVILAGDRGKLAKLGRAEVAVRDRNAQHRRLALNVEAVLEAQRAVFVFAQFASEITVRLIAELGNALIYIALVICVVTVHGDSLNG